jgi:hypothetical protein
MQVYQDFCTQSQNNCLHCPFPDVVRKYFSWKTLKMQYSHCAFY